MPRIDELLVSVRDFLRDDVMAATSGRLSFLSRVAGNSLDMRVIDGALSALAPRPADDLEVILEDDQRAREVGRGLVRRLQPVRA